MPNLYNIVYSADNGYKFQLITSIISLLENANKDTKYQLTVLIPDDFDINMQKNINKILSQYNMPEVFFIKMGEKFKEASNNIKHITNATYYRLELMNLVDCDLCLYLDCDVIVQKDLKELFSVNMEDCYIAGVKAPVFYSNKEEQAKRLMLPDFNSYVNAGVILMNLSKMRKDNLHERFIELLKYNFAINDQDIINKACFGHIKILPPKYNSMTRYNNSNINSYNNPKLNCLKLCYTKEEWTEACTNPYIIHYAAEKKPWNNSEIDFAGIWTKYEKKFYEYFPNGKIDALISDFKDSTSLISGWHHDFFCPDCASPLIYECNRHDNSVFKCSKCKNEVTDEKYLQAWIYEYRNKYSEALENITKLYTKGNKQYLDFIIKYLDFYADNYENFPVHGEHIGKGKIMAQSLDEAVWGINALRTVYLLKNDIPAEKISGWYDRLFIPMANLLIPQANEIHNISFWIWCFIAMTGIVFDNKELTDIAINGEFGIKEQLKQGLTKDYFWQEGSIPYHYYTLEALTYFCEFYHNIKPDNEFEKIMKEMYKAPLKLSHDNFHLPSINDSWYPITVDSYKKQYEKAKSFCDIDLIAEQKDKDTAFDNHIGIINKPFKIMLKSGSLVQTHMHRDLLSIIIPEFSEDIGTSGYGTPLNTWYKNSLAHNTFSVDGIQQRSIIPTTINKLPNGYEAVVSNKDWSGITAKRSLIIKGNSIEDVTEITSDDEHCFDFTFHSDYTPFYNCQETYIGSFNNPLYKYFKDVKKIEHKKNMEFIYTDNKYRQLTVSIKISPKTEVYIAKTPGNPALNSRSTLLLRIKDKKAKFQLKYNISDKIKKERISDFIKRKSKLPKISIIIPCYNTEKYIKEAIESACNQTLKDIEIIIINDGSTDNSLKIVQKAAKKDKRIKIINQENQGVAFSRNEGIKLAKGKYIYFLDSDDLIASPEVLEYCYNLSEKNKLDIITGSGSTLYQSQELEEQFPDFRTRYAVKAESNEVMSGVDAINFLRKHKSYYVLQGTRLLNKKFLQKNNILFPLVYTHEDAAFTYSTLYCAKRVMIIQKTMLIRRLREDSLMTSPLSAIDLFGYLGAFMDAVKLIEAKKNEIPINDTTGYPIMSIKAEFFRIFNLIDKKEINKFLSSATKEQLYYFRTFLKNEANLKAKLLNFEDSIKEGSTQNKVLINNIFKYASNRIGKPIKGFDYSKYTNPVNIALIADNNFFIPLCTTIQSIIMSKKADSYYKIHVINSEFDEKNKIILNNMQTENVEIIIKNFDVKKFKEFEENAGLTKSNVSTTALTKFDLPYILKEEEKVLYLDSDIIVKNDLSQLYNTALTNEYAAAAVESGVMYNDPKEIQYYSHEYFNSGVMLLNLKLLRQDNVPEKLLQIKKEQKDVAFMDQDALNIVFKGRVKFLPIIYNFMCCNLERASNLWNMGQLNELFQSKYSSLEDIKEEAVIVHYASKDKPWTNTTIPMYNLWYDSFSNLCESFQVN